MTYQGVNGAHERPTTGGSQRQSNYDQRNTQYLRSYWTVSFGAGIARQARFMFNNNQTQILDLQVMPSLP